MNSGDSGLNSGSVVGGLNMLVHGPLDRSGSFRRRIKPTSRPASASPVDGDLARTTAVQIYDRCGCSRCNWPATALTLPGDAIQIANADNPLTAMPIANAIA